MKRFSKHVLARIIGVFSLTALLASTLIPTFTAVAAIEATDYFQLTAAGNATTMDSGGSLVFTLNAKDASNAANTLAGADYAFFEIMSAGTDGYSETVDADVTAVGGGVSVKASASIPWGGTTAADISGTSDRFVAVNVDATGTGTVTVIARQSFNACVWAMGAAMNNFDTGAWNDGGTPPGQDCRQITVSNASSGADHLKADFGSATTAEANEQKTVTITQVNSGGGLVTSALTNAVIDTNATSVTSGVLSGIMESSADTTLGSGNGIVKFTSAANTTAYYMVSLITNGTFKIMGASNVIYSNSNIIEATGLSAGGKQAEIDAGADVTITKDTATTLQTTADTTLVAGNILSITGTGGTTCSSRGYFIVTAVVNAGASSTVTVMGHTNGFDNCVALAGGAGGINLVNITSNGSASAYTVSNGAAGVADGYIYSVGGVATGNQTTTVVTGKTLTAGTLSAVVVATETGAFTITPYSPTVNASSPTTDTLTTGAATDMTIQGYGPSTGQSNVPVMAPIDFFFNKDPSAALTFPLTNTLSSAFSITSGGTAVTGSWYYSSETWGADTIYRVTFAPTTPFNSSTAYTVSVTKAFASSKGSTNLTDGTTVWTSAFTTGIGGGDFVEGGEFSGTMGGKFPPIAMLNYPMPGQYIPTNINCVIVDFDRPMTFADLSASNIYIKKVVGETLSATLPAGTPTVTVLGDDNDSVCIAGDTDGSDGYIFEANSKYCVVVDNDLTSTDGDFLAGTPGTSAEGCGGQGMGFGFANMGPFEEFFYTGAGLMTIIATWMGTNLDLYNSGGAKTNVPTGIIPRVTFDEPLNPVTVNATNVTLKRGGVAIEGNVYYDPEGNAIEFVPNAALTASMTYNLGISLSVTSISGTAITPVSFAFTTGAADVTKPQVAHAEADNYGLSIQFNEPLNQTTAENGSYYTLKTCSASTIAADGTTCGSGSPTTFSLLSGVNIHYEREDNSVWMDGLTLTPGDGFYVGVGTGVTDMSANAIHATDNKSWTGIVMDGAKFGGGQGMFQQDTFGMEDFNMKSTLPNARPMNSMANTTTTYFLDIPLTSAIPADGYIELTFPAGTDVSGVLQDQYSPMNSDFNGPSTGSPTFKAGVTSSVSTDTASSGAGTLAYGIGHIAAARKVYIQLSATTLPTDFLHIDIAGIRNLSVPRGFDTSGYQVDIKTFNPSGTLLESMITMPYFISQAGTNTISGQITAGGAGVNGVRVFLDSWAAGFQETTTSLDGAGTLVAGSNNGEYKFENLPNGDYHIFVEPSNGYTGGDFKIDNVTTATTKNIALTALNGTNCATLPVSINITNIGNITSLGSSDSVDVFGWNTTGMGGFVKTLTRAQVIGSVATPVNMFICDAGMYNLGIGPSMPKGTFSAFPKMEWMPPQNLNVNVVAANIGGAAMSTLTFAVSAPDATITGIVKDSAGTAVSGGKVFADFSAGGFGGDAEIGVDGTFSIPVSKNKSYRVGAFIPGMPPAQDHFVSINASGNVFIDGSPTASTGSSGANPFVLTMQFNSTTSVTVSGRVSDGTNAIAGAGVWAHRTDAMRPPVNGSTDSSGNYVLYIPSAGTWQVEANAPGLGFLGSKTLTVTTDDFTGQDFEPLSASEMSTLTVGIDKAGTTEDSGVSVMAHNADGNFNQCITESDGTCEISVPIDATDAYTVEAWDPTLGQLLKTTQVLNETTETLSPAALGTSRTFTITLEEAVNADTFVDFESTTGMGTGVVIPAGETVATVTLPQGDYYFSFDMPFDETNVTVTGAEFNNTDGTPETTDSVNLDGTGDNILLTLPDLNTVSGTIADNGTGVEDVSVTIIDTSTQDTFTVLTGSNGDYTAKIPDGTYSVLAEQSGYVGTPEDITVTTNLPDQDVALDPADQTMAGTITNSTGTPVEGALVYATRDGGGTVMDETDSSGNYEMHVSDGIWNVEAVTDGYIESGTPLAVNATNANVIDADIQLPATTVALEDPATMTVDSSNANRFADTDLKFDITVPANSVDADAVLNLEGTNELLTTRSANPFSTGIGITGVTANDFTPITGFDNYVDLVFEYTVANLATEGIDTTAEMVDVNIGFINENTNNWTMMPTAITYYNSTGTVIPDSTVEGYTTLVAAATGVDLTTIALSTTTDHLTTFAPVVSSGATPPATPSGLSATVGNGQVTLSWTKNSEVDMSYYNIWEANVTEGILTTLTQAACTVTPCTKVVQSLTNGTAYSFQILAVDTDGNSSAGSTAASATPVAATTPTGGGTILNSGGSSKKTVTETDEDEEATDETTDEEATTGEPGTSGANLGAGAGASGPTPFTDIVGHWAELYIDDLYSKNVLSGASEDKFEPDSYVSRAEISKIVVTTFGLETLDAISIDTNPFKDVSKDMWYATYIKAASDDGLMKGYNDGTFKPDRKITRAEALKVFLIGALGADGVEDKIATEYDAEFSDVDAGEWYAPYINYAAEKGIVNGYMDGTFGPDNYLTRAEIAKIASKVLSTELAAEVIGMIMGIL